MPPVGRWEEIAVSRPHSDQQVLLENVILRTQSGSEIDCRATHRVCDRQVST